MPERQIATRLKHLRTALGYQRQTGFAEALGMELRRWNNIERGTPLSIDVACRIVRRFPGVTLDYLYFGTPDGLSVAMAQRLDVIAAHNHTPHANLSTVKDGSNLF